jgi:hypothetical protein
MIFVWARIAADTHVWKILGEKQIHFSSFSDLLPKKRVILPFQDEQISLAQQPAKGCRWF